MRVLFKMPIVGASIALLLFLGAVWAGVGRQDGFECVHVACNSAPVIVNGTMGGCTQAGAGCAGTCYSCSANTVADICAPRANMSCTFDFQLGTIACGTRTEYVGGCGGVWAAGCTCAMAPATARATVIPCSLMQCVP